MEEGRRKNGRNRLLAHESLLGNPDPQQIGKGEKTDAQGGRGDAGVNRGHRRSTLGGSLKISVKGKQATMSVWVLGPLLKVGLWGRMGSLGRRAVLWP